MNKHLYRIIFNQSRGQLMVVQEDARGQGKGNGAEGVAATLAAACKAFSLRLSVLLIGLGLGSSALAADIIADPNAAAGKQPGVIQSANGLPVVQIAAPTAAGVSHNQYQQFNVGPGGALLNNSAVNVNTQLAGYISGNPNLKNGSARIILNEVTQANPSQLRGYLEVAGQRAQVVIANPWGITCSGCGFINTQQATLTTGAPQLNAQGALTGYQVAGGRVSIDGAGLNAANVDSFAIISRAVSINANLYAQKLDLVLGRNQVDAATLAAQPLTASPSDAPAFALDVAQLGGMYANAIKLVGTEKGVGVNQLGTLAAQAGDLQLTSAGDLILRGQIHSQQNLILQADGQLRHDGVTRAEGSVQADIVGQAVLRQALSAGGDLTLNTGSLQGDGALAAGAQADGKLGDHGRLTVTSAGMLQHSGQLLAGGDVSLRAGQADLSHAAVSASHGALDIRAAGDVSAQQARLSAAGAARLTLDGQLDNRSGQLAAAQVDLQLGALDNREGKIVQTGQADSVWRINGQTDNRQGLLASAGHELKLQSGNLDNRGGEISHAGGGALRLSADTLDNREQGRIASDGRLDTQAAQLDNRQGRLAGVQSASVDARLQLNNDGGVLGSDGKLDLSAGALDNGAGLIQSGLDLQLTAASLTNADKGQILALGKDAASQVDVSGELHNQGKLAGNADLTVNAATIDNSKGTLQAAAGLNLTKQTSLTNDGGHIAGQSLKLNADSLSNQAGEIYAQQQLTSQLKTFDNTKGSVIGGQGVDLTVSSLLHNDGVVGSDGQVKVSAGKLENAAGTIQSGKDLQLNAASLTNADKGQILALGKDAASQVDVSGELRNQGKVAGNADLTVNAATIDNAKGTLQAANHLELSKQTSLINDGGHIAGQNLKLNADSLSNQAGEIYAQQQLSSTLKTLNNAQGSLIGGQGVDLTVFDQLHNDGVLGSDGQVKLTAGKLENAAGTIQSGKDLQLSALSLTNADKGQILALGKDVASTVDVTGELHNQGKVAGNADLTVNAATIDNAKGTLQAAAGLNLTKQSSLINDGGHIAGQSLKLKADSLSNQAGEIYAQQQLTSQLKTLDNAKGSLIGGQSVDLEVVDSLHNDGVLGSDGQVKLSAGKLDNAAGTIQSGKDLQLTANSLSNADKGQILALGKDAASKVDVSDELHNQGKVAGNADLTVNAATIDNSKGTLQAASHLELSKQRSLTNDGGHIAGRSLKLNADSLSNQAGEIYAQQQLSSQLKTLNNSQGSLIGGLGVDLTVSSLLHNDGVVGSDGQVKLSAGTLENAAGAIQSGKDLQLTAASLTNADKGQILALGKDAASTVDVSGELHNQGKVAGNADLTVNAATIDNSKGTLQAASHLELSKQSTLTNDGGHIAGQSLKLNADSLSNQAGEIYAQQQLTSQLKTFDNTKGSVIGGQGVDLTVSSLLRNDGVVGSDGQVKLSAGTLENASGIIQSGKDLQLTASSLTNADKGQILALGKDAASQVDVSGELHNQGKVAGNADLTVNAATIDNSKGTLQAAAGLNLTKQTSLTNDGGHIAGQSLKLNADLLSNQAGEIYAQQQLTSQLRSLDNHQGSLIGGQGVDLTVSSLLHNDGVVGSDGQVKLTAGTLENAAGTIQSGKDLQLTASSLTNTDKGQILALGKDAASKVDVSGELHNQGKVAGNTDLTVNAATIDNSKGTLQAAAGLNLTKQTSLTNNGGHIAGQSLKLNADSLSNQAGEIYAQQQLSSQLKTLDNRQGSLIGGQGVDLTVSDQLHNDGVVGSDGQVKLSVGTLENAAGTIQSGKDLQLTASSLNNADKGQILALGKDAASTVDVSGELHNQGKVAGNADLTVNAATIDNTKGTLQAANHLELYKQSSLTNDGGHIAGQSLKLNANSLSNQSGEIYAQQQLSSQLKTLNNSQGSLIGGQGVDLTVSSLLHNDGVVGSDGQVKLSAGTLENASGTIQSGKDLQLTANSLTNADKGQILALGKDAVSKVDVSGELHNQGKVAGNADLTVNAATIDNSKGTLQAAAGLNLTKQTSLTNDGGRIAGQSLKLNADSLSNQAGEIYAQQQLSSQLKTFDNTKGSVIGGQGVDLAVSTLLHNDGLLGSDGQVKLSAGTLENAFGTIQSGKDLQLTASSLTNADKGQILALGKDAASQVDVSGELHNQGKVAGNADLTVNAATIDNAKGTLQAASHLKLSKQTSLTNDGGHIAAQNLNLKTDTLSNQSGDIRQIGAGEAKLKIGQAFHNQQGQLLSNGGLTLDAGQLDNRQGTLASGQALTLTSQGALDNQKGTVQGDSLQLNAASLDNRGGGIKALGTGDSRIQLDGKLDNSAAGTLAANGNLTLTANQLDNSGSVLQSAAKLDVQLKQDAQNGGGTLQAGQLKLSAASLGNQHGQIGQAGAGQATLTIGGQIDNSQQGKITSGGQLQVTAGDLNNNQGVLSSQGDLTLRGSALNNQQGTLGSNGALTLNAGSLDNSGGLLQAGQTLQLDSGSLRNAGGKVLALGAGDSRLTVTGQLVNGGQIAGNGNWQLEAQGLDNSGGSIYGQRNLAVDTVSLANAGSLLAGQDLSLKLQGDFINNAGTQLQANRNLSISASGNLVNNGQLQSSGNLSLSGVNWTNNGSVNIGGTLSTQLSQSLLNYGSLGAGALDLHAASLTNTASITAGDITIQAGSLDNSGGKALLASAGGMALNIGGTLNNHDGAWLYSQGDMRIGQTGAAVGQVVNHIATLQSDGNMFIEAGRVSNESNPVSVSATTSKTESIKKPYGYFSTALSYTTCGKDSTFICVDKQMDYVGYVDFGGSWAESYSLVRDDVINRKLTFRVGSASTGNYQTVSYIGRYGSGYVYSPGFDSDKNTIIFNYPKQIYGLSPLQMENAQQVWSVVERYGGDYGKMVAGDQSTYQGGYSAIIPLAQIVQSDSRNIVASSKEAQRTVATSISTDVASGAPVGAKIFAGGQLSIGANDIVNSYSTISVSGGVNVSRGAISNVGQELYRTVSTTTSILMAGNCFGCGSYTIQGPVSSYSEKIGSLDATIATNQHLSLQAPTIVNGKDAARVNVSTVAGNAVNNQSAVSQAQGLAVSGAGQQVATTGQTLQGSVGEAQGAQLNGALSSVAGQALGGTAAQGETGKTLQGAVGQAQGAQLSGALSSVAGQVLGGTAAQGEAGKVLQGALGQVQGAQLNGALSGADGQHLKNGGVDAAAGSQLAKTYLPAPATQQVTMSAGGAKAANPVANGYAVPDNGLFHAKPAPQQPYLVETNPQFTQYSNFISSDYLLKQLNYDPSKVEKRLGDGFYEQQLVTRAVTDMTGKRFLSGYGSAMQQYQQLMSNGAQYAKQFQLTPGMALSADQMAKLTSDMVWLVKQNVGGQDVLVPMVYLANADQESLRGQGAVLAGNSMSLLASGDLVNTGTLKSDTTLLAQANNIRIEGGKVQAGGDLGLLAAQNLTITDDSQHSQAGSSVKTGGDLQLQAGNDLKLQAAAIDAAGNASLQAGHDLDIASRETRYDLGGGNRYSSYQYQQADHVGSQLNIGGSLALAAGNDLTLSGSAAKAGGSVLASAGGSLALASTLDSKHGAGSWWGGGYDTLSQTHNASLLQGGGDVLLKAGGDLSLTGSTAQSSGGSLTALAGKQLTVQSEVNTHHDIGYNWGNSHNWQADSLTVAGLAGKGDLQLRAGGDALLNGASLASGGKLVLSAGNDIKLGAVATESRNDNTWGETIRNNYDLTQHGVAAHGEGGLILQAGRDISTQAASLTSNGQEALVAGRDVTLGSAQERHSDYSKTVHHSSGWFSSSTTTDIVAHDSTHEAGSTVSADTLILKGQRDINIHASQVAGSGDVTLDAGRNLNITSGTDTSRLFQYHKEETSGLFSGGGLGFTIGSKELTQQMDGAGTTQSQNRSLVGSIGGNLNIKTGDTLTLQGSDVTAGGNLLLDAKKQNLDVAVDTWHSVQKTVSKSSGLTLQLTSPLINGLQAMESATETALKSKDDRVKALSAATAALAGYNSYTAYQQAMSDAGQKTKGGIQLSLTVGGSRSESTTVSDSHNESGSLLKASGNVMDLAHGAGKDSTITAKGAQFIAGKDLTLQAEGDITLLAAKSASSEHTTSSASSGAVGVAIGFQENRPQVGFTANGSLSRGRVDGNGSQYQLSELNAGGKLNLQSGGNLTLQGIASGQQVVGDIAGDLKIDSLQDTSTYHSLNQSISGNVTIGPIGSGGSVSLSQQKMDADYASVQRQSGIQAGDGGFQLTVKGATALNGAAIASTDKAAQDGKNSLQTGALVLKDIGNHADFTASSISVSAGTDGVTGMAMAASDHDNSTTRAGVSAGSLTITDNALQQAKTGQTAEQAAASANRDVSTGRDGSGKLANNFNASEVQGLFDAANALNQQVGTFMANKAAEAKAAADALKDADPNSPDYASKKQAADDTAKWAPGGSYSQILTAVTAGIGGIGGNLANGLTGMAQNAGIAYLQGLGAQEVKALADDLERAQSNDPDHADKKPEGEVVRAVLHAALACAGAEASGQSCGAGAAGGAASVALNNALDKLQHTDADKMTAEEKLQRENLVNGLLTGLSTATGGSGTAATTANAAKTELENNGLTGEPPRVVRNPKASAVLEAINEPFGIVDPLNDVQEAIRELKGVNKKLALEHAIDVLKKMGIDESVTPSLDENGKIDRYPESEVKRLTYILNSNWQAQNSKNAAFRDAKRDAGIPMAQQPYKVERVDFIDGKTNKRMFDENGKVINSYQYYFKIPGGQDVVIQNHMEGHDFGGVGDQGPHFNLRPSDGLKNGHVDGSKDHYYVFPGRKK